MKQKLIFQIVVHNSFLAHQIHCKCNSSYVALQHKDSYDAIVYSLKIEVKLVSTDNSVQTNCLLEEHNEYSGIKQTD